MAASPLEVLRIFVSHSHKDNDFGTKLVYDLRNLLDSDTAVWYDTSGGLLGGDVWWRKIQQELTARPVFIVVLSPDAVASPWVNDEIDLAWRQKNSTTGKRIIPVLYRSCEVRDDLSNLHVVSFLSPKTYEVAFNELLKALGIPMNAQTSKVTDSFDNLEKPLALEETSQSTQSPLSNSLHHLVALYWQEASKLTGDLQPDLQFSTPQLVAYLSGHLPSGCEQMTPTKVNYLRAQGILKPVESGGKIRASWRYTTSDVRRAIVMELLRTRESLSVQESKGWLRSFEEAQIRGVLNAQVPRVTTQEISIPTPPTPVSSAYALLRNRTLGTLITALGSGEAEVTPPRCLIAIRVLDHTPETSQFDKLSWDQVRILLENGSWSLAASDSYFKLYVYPDLQQLQENRPEVANMLPQHHWYFVTLQDTSDQFYEIVLGLPDVQQPSIAAINKSLTQHIKNNSPVKLSNFPGLSTLLKAAFVKQTNINEGTTLSVLADIIATVSDAWDYCDILVPEPANKGEEKWLSIQGYSSNFPSQLKDKRVEVGQSLSGWCYRDRQSVIVESTAENDPRIAFYNEEERPIAAAAIPAIAAEEQRVVGVIYVARRTPIRENQVIFSEELIASLEAFGYICGDMIVREQIEIETVRNTSRLATRPLITSFPHLDAMFRKVADEVRRGGSPEKASHSWVYLLTLSIQATSQDIITRWLCQQGIEMTGNFLAFRLWNPPLRHPLPIGRCKVSSDRYVFAILQAVDLPEQEYKQGITRLQMEMNQMRIGRLSPEFYLSAVTFRYDDLRQQFYDKGLDKLVGDLAERTRESLIAGPYFKRGHEALYTSDLDHAVSEFEDALRYVPMSWYGHKHLAEARMLQGTERAIEQAIETCQTAIELNPNYASAHCLLADCLSYRGKFGEALVEYEKTLVLDTTDRDFLTRYGLALAGMTPSEYQNALMQLRQQAPELAQQHNHFDQPWLEAIDKFDRVRKLSAMYNDTPEEERRQRADYHYHRGYAYLQAGWINKAVEDFTVGRKLSPDNLQLAQAYSYALRLRRREEGNKKSTEIGQSQIKEIEA